MEKANKKVKTTTDVDIMELSAKLVQLQASLDSFDLTNLDEETNDHEMDFEAKYTPTAAEIEENKKVEMMRHTIDSESVLRHSFLSRSTDRLQ